MHRTRLVIAVIFISLASTATAAELQIAPYAFASATLTPSQPVTVMPLVVDECTSLYVVTSLLWPDTTVTLISPTGTRFVVGDPPAIGIESFKSVKPGGSNHHMSLALPTVGTWQVEVVAAGLTGPVDVVINAHFHGASVVAALAAPATVIAGDTAVVSLSVFDGTQPLAGATVSATSYSPDGTVVPVTFTDTGTFPDRSAGDGHLAATLTTAGAGKYDITAVVDGTGSGGAFRRFARATVAAVAQTATLTGTFSDAGVDSDADGVFETLVVSPHVAVTTTGKYLLSVQLDATNGKSMMQTAAAVLEPGNQAVAVAFDAEQLVAQIAIGGPYVVSRVELKRLENNQPVVIDVRTDLGTTGAHALSSFLPKGLRLTGTYFNAAYDRDDDGLFEVLTVLVGVSIPQEAFYSVSGALRASDGTVVALSQHSKDFAAGEADALFNFLGTDISIRGLDGPYEFDFLMYGNGESLFEPNLFSTAFYAAAAFKLPPPPDISGFSPSETVREAHVRLTGLNFTGARAVTFNGKPSTNFAVLDDNTIRAQVPIDAHSGVLAVTTLAGTGSSTSPLTVILAPTNLSFTPDHGAPGTIVTIRGANLATTSAVRFNGSDAPFTVVSNAEITATVPHTATSGAISITNADGVGETAALFHLPPVLSSFAPSAAVVGATVRIYGTNLAGVTAALFNGDAGMLTAVHEGEVSVTVPAGATSGVLTVVSPGGTADSVMSFDVLPAGLPTVTATATNSGTISVSWTGDVGHTYEVRRISGVSEYFSDHPVARVTGTTFVDSSVAPETTYLYNIMNLTTGLVGNSDYATTVIFDDDPLTTSTVVKAVHVEQLRAAVNALRVASGVGAKPWTVSSVSGAPVSASHILELRVALNEALIHLNRWASFTDPELTTETFVRRAHFAEIRAAVK